jgi:hypothetical protein
MLVKALPLLKPAQKSVGAGANLGGKRELVALVLDRTVHPCGAVVV